MDYKYYRSSWRQQEEGDELPDVRIPVLASQWDLRLGGHPSLLNTAADFYERNPFKDTQLPDVSLEFQVRPMGCVHGHNTLADIGYTSLVDVDINIPTSPLFVRDLCGRVIYIGYGPEEKRLDQWRNYGADRQVQTAEGEIDYPNAIYPTVTFPEYCREVTEENVPNSDYIEQVFFCKFRTLDMSFDFAAHASGQPEELAAGLYGNANLYPYKLRLDTFYTDGYKLPQTQMVFARQDISAHQARKAAEKLMQAWADQPESAGYDSFVESLGGQVEELYEQGCTLIPTFEACNGFHKVGQDFELLDYWAGCAVKGLHDVVEERESDEPPGTILIVQEPGYVTAWDVKPAKVIISNGAWYASENTDDPAPLIPNLNLPHQRTINWWGSTWLPTHPEHFEAPAIWGWDAVTGRFLQLMGPLWDPLHYYYECTDVILAAFEKPMEENRWLVEVPEEMENRFYPIVPMQGFDTIDENERVRRYENMLLPRSAVKRIPMEEESAAIGYHPLPLQFEYELDPYWTPNLHPANREIGICPEDMLKRLSLVISSAIPPRLYLNTVEAPDECVWLNSIDYLMPSQGTPLQDYPFLVRYLDDELPDEEIFAMSAGLFLEEVPAYLLENPPEKIWQDIDALDDLEQLAPSFFDAAWDMREESLKLIQKRHRLYQKNPALYAYAWWICVDGRVLEEFFNEWEALEALKNMPEQVDRANIPLGSQVMPVSAGQEHNMENAPEPVFSILEEDEEEDAQQAI
ncbi:MAG: hypothetical protein OXR68_02380 [Alphaproteobacteria bacterium]|nr:hypothetical protein [Alphaproteobacteria bacterium]MDD9919455.1 hypothetical protein [Alphaproteobacteria bacterium]